MSQSPEGSTGLCDLLHRGHLITRKPRVSIPRRVDRSLRHRDEMEGKYHDVSVSIPRRVDRSLRLNLFQRTTKESLIVSIPRRVDRSLRPRQWTRSLTEAGEMCLNPPKGRPVFATGEIPEGFSPTLDVSIPRRVDRSLRQGSKLAEALVANSVSIPRRVDRSLRRMYKQDNWKYSKSLNPPKGRPVFATFCVLR